MPKSLLYTLFCFLILLTSCAHKKNRIESITAWFSDLREDVLKLDLPPQETESTLVIINSAENSGLNCLSILKEKHAAFTKKFLDYETTRIRLEENGNDIIKATNSCNTKMHEYQNLIKEIVGKDNMLALLKKRKSLGLVISQSGGI